MSILKRFTGGLKALFTQRHAEHDMDAELHEFLAEAIENKVRAGMSLEQATRAARIEMGSLESVKDGIRSAGWESTLEAFWQDVRYAVRVLGKQRGFTAVAVLTLALGIGANTAIFSLIDAVTLRILPVAQPHDLVQVRMRDPRSPGEPNPNFTNALWEQVRGRQDVFSNIFAWDEEGFDLSQGGAVHMARGLVVSGDFFPGLQVQPAAGRLLTPSDDRPGCPAVAVLGYDFWQDQYGGAKSVVGGKLSLNTHPFEIVGVSRPGFYGMNVGSKFDVAIPVCTTRAFDGQQSRLDHRSWWWLSIAGRLKPGIRWDQLTARLSVVSPGIFEAALPLDWAKDGQAAFLKKSLEAVPAATGVSNLRRQFERPLQVLMAVVGLVLLIACANIASLMMARAAARHKEIAVRQALGASRWRLIRQLLTECILLSCSGALIGILFARWGTALLVRFISSPKHPLFLDLSPDIRVLGFTAGVAILAGVLFGVLPALRSTRVSLTSAMKANQTSDGEHRARLGVRRWIVASQVALSLVLLVSAGLLLRSFVKLATRDVGFDRNNVLLVGAFLNVAKIPPGQESATNEAIESRLRALPGVVSAACSVMTPISGGAWNNTIHTEWSKALTGDNALTWFNYVSPSYFETLRMPLLAGRGFGKQDTKAGQTVAVVNQTLAHKFFSNLDPLGKTFRIDDIGGKLGPPIEVVGVIQDSKYESMREDTLPTAFFPVSQAPAHADSLTFEVRTAVRPTSMIGAVQTAIAKVNKDIPLFIGTLSEQVDESMVQERMLALLSAFFGGLALLLAMIGLYGTLSYVVAQRRSEFGIRMALGAPGGSILRLVLRDVVSVLAGGLVVGVCISLAATRLLQQMLFGLGARDTVTIVGAAGMLTVVALVAGYLPARRATKVDPLVALRYE